MAGIEDSAHAIFTLVVASNAAARRARKGFSSHFVPWCNARALSQFPRGYTATNNSGDSLVQSMQSRKPLNAFAAEFFAQGILRCLGIATAEQIICNAKEARALPDNFVVKVAGEEPAQNLTWNPDSVRTGWCLASKLVPDAASLDFIARKLITTEHAKTQILRQCALAHAEKDRGFEELIGRTLGKTCVAADKFFAAFRPTESELKLIADAMAIDGKEYLQICAARVFLGCSAPHFGNVLATKTGELISLDHARASYEKNDDIRKMFYFVSRPSKAFDVLSGVARLSERDVREAVLGIPKHRACGSTTGMADYYSWRLQLWKQLYADNGIRRLPEMEIDPKLTCWNPLGSFGQSLMQEAAALRLAGQRKQEFPRSRS
jgi:hypothetical protein